MHFLILATNQRRQARISGCPCMTLHRPDANLHNIQTAIYCGPAQPAIYIDVATRSSHHSSPSCHVLRGGGNTTLWKELVFVPVPPSFPTAHCSDCACKCLGTPCSSSRRGSAAQSIASLMMLGFFKHFPSVLLTLSSLSITLPPLGLTEWT